MTSPNEISPRQLARLIGTPEQPVLIDLRIPADAAADATRLPGAFRHPYQEAEALVPQIGARKSVVYCQKGRKISQGVTSLLASHGVACESLAGGHLAWQAAGLPAIPLNALPRDRGTLWVTRHRPKIDRIACPWLIRRFVDPEARFLYVAPAEVEAVAEKFDAIPYDVEGVHYSHRGARCTFDAMIEEFGLSTPALENLARVVRAADTNAHDLAPEAAGLLAISVGLSRQYSDDHAQLAAGMAIYDALYRWVRDGQGEGHDWPTGAAQ